MSFITDTIDLSMVSSETGEYLAANIYYIEGVKDTLGALRPLSIGQLVMAICLQRAADLEDQIIVKMSEMEKTSECSFPSPSSSRTSSTISLTPPTTSST